MFLFAWPSFEKRRTRDRGAHNLLDAPTRRRGAPRSASALLALLAVVFVAGAGDRLFVFLGVPYPDQVWFFRVCFFVLPVGAFLVTRRLCRDIASGNA